MSAGQSMTDAAADPYSIRVAKAAELLALAASTGDSRFAVAGGILAGQRGGRRRCDDDAAVAEIDVLLAAGAPRSVTHGARMIAKVRREPSTEESVTTRLAHHYRKVYTERKKSFYAGFVDDYSGGSVNQEPAVSIFAHPAFLQCDRRLGVLDQASLFDGE